MKQPHEDTPEYLEWEDAAKRTAYALECLRATRSRLHIDAAATVSDFEAELILEVEALIVRTKRALNDEGGR